MTEKSPNKSGTRRLLLLAVDVDATDAARGLIEQLGARYAQEIRYCVERGTAAAAGGRASVDVEGARCVVVDGVTAEEFVAALQSLRGRT